VDPDFLQIGDRTALVVPVEFANHEPTAS